MNDRRSALVKAAISTLGKVRRNLIRTDWETFGHWYQIKVDEVVGMLMEAEQHPDRGCTEKKG